MIGIALRQSSKIKRKQRVRNKFTIQYISDVHVDVRKEPIVIKPIAKYLAICGDIGIPSHPAFIDFLEAQTKNFEKVFFVPGNHDFNLGPMFLREKYEIWNSIMKQICAKYPNLYYLNCDYFDFENIRIIGCTLWSRPPDYKFIQLQPNIKINLVQWLEHLKEHEEHVDWLSKNIHPNKQNIVLTHFVPTYQLIENKYRLYPKINQQWFYSDLEHLLLPPINAWICGHSHSIINKTINEIFCAINACPHSDDNGKKFEL